MGARLLGRSPAAVRFAMTDTSERMPGTAIRCSLGCAVASVVGVRVEGEHVDLLYLRHRRCRHGRLRLVPHRRLGVQLDLLLRRFVVLGRRARLLERRWWGGLPTL